MGCVLFNLESQLSWTDASLQCKFQGANLIEILSLEELNYVRAELAGKMKGKCVWTDGSDAIKEGKFKWYNSLKPVESWIWRRGEPNGGNFICLYNDGFFMAADCPDTNHENYICQKKPATPLNPGKNA